MPYALLVPILVAPLVYRYAFDPTNSLDSKRIIVGAAIGTFVVAWWGPAGVKIAGWVGLVGVGIYLAILRTVKA